MAEEFAGERKAWPERSLANEDDNGWRGHLIQRRATVRVVVGGVRGRGHGEMT